MKKVAILVMLCAMTLSDAYSQGLNFIGRFNRSFGFQYETLNFSGEEFLYSPGGGAGLEAGLQVELSQGFFLQSTLGYQLHWVYQGTTSNGYSNKSSFTFNRKFVTAGLTKKVMIDEDDMLNAIILGGGISYHMPGTLKRTENDYEYPELTYNSSMGWYIEGGVNLKLSEKSDMMVALRYRNLGFTLDSNSGGTLTGIPDSLRDLNANGLELSLTLALDLRKGEGLNE